MHSPVFSFLPKGKRERKGNEKRRPREAVSGEEWLCSGTGSVVGFGRPVRKRTILALPNLGPPSIEWRQRHGKITHIRALSKALAYVLSGLGPARPGRAFSGPLLISTGCQAELNPPADLRIQSVRQECKTRVPTRGRGRASGPPRKFTACVDDGGAAFALFTSCPSPAPEC